VIACLRWEIALLTLQYLLKEHPAFAAGAKIKLVRHAGGGVAYKELAKEKWGFLNDQHNQPKHEFKDCSHIISFIGMERRRSLMAGVYRIDGANELADGRYRYDMQPEQGFEDYLDRVVIDWGGNPRAWNQNYATNPKEVTEILPHGYLGDFPGVLDFVLDFDELTKLIANPEANADWLHHLSAVNGIYLILYTKEGKQYIGSANGKEGIWQRWSNYANTKHCNNKKLRLLMEPDADYQRHFRYSILQTLPSNITQREIVAIENLYKQKLGSKAHGLNAN
jgi:hypothetical protein